MHRMLKKETQPTLYTLSYLKFRETARLYHQWTCQLFLDSIDSYVSNGIGYFN